MNDLVVLNKIFNKLIYFEKYYTRKTLANSGDNIEVRFCFSKTDFYISIKVVESRVFFTPVITTPSGVYSGIGTVDLNTFLIDPFDYEDPVARAIVHVNEVMGEAFEVSNWDFERESTSEQFKQFRILCEEVREILKPNSLKFITESE